MSRKLPVGVLSVFGQKWDNLAMETLLKRLAQIGVEPAIVDAIRASGDMERALILLMDDDRHEYVD